METYRHPKCLWPKFLKKLFHICEAFSCKPSSYYISVMFTKLEPSTWKCLTRVNYKVTRHVQSQVMFSNQFSVKHEPGILPLRSKRQQHILAFSSEVRLKIFGTFLAVVVKSLGLTEAIHLKYICFFTFMTVSWLIWRHRFFCRT